MKWKCVSEVGRVLLLQFQITIDIVVDRISFESSLKYLNHIATKTHFVRYL